MPWLVQLTLKSTLIAPFSGGTLVCRVMAHGIDHLRSHFRFLVYIPHGTGRVEGGGSIV